MFWLILCFGLTVLFSLLLINRAAAWGFVDIPEARKIHAIPTPRTGGLGMVCGILATFLIYLGAGHSWPAIPWQTLAAGAGFAALGGLDDQYGFHPKKKFRWFVMLALLAAWPWAFTGPVGSPYSIHLGERVLQAPRWLAYPVLTTWFLSVPNAVNIEDAINGYMGGFTLIMLGVAAALGVNVILPVGALLGFLLLNWPKARHFLGDAGSFGCGFIVAEVLLRAGGNQRPLLALLLTAPISMDVCTGMIRRIRLKMSLFQADRFTFPHHMLNFFNQSHTLASLVLWANAGIIAWLAFCRLAYEGGYLVFFALVLIAFNWVPLLKPSALERKEEN